MKKICKICGSPIYGGHNKKYCESCLKQVRADQHIKYRAREAAGISRKLGSTDICGLCGNPYSVSSSRQRYCQKCSSISPRPSRRVLPDDYYTSGATPTGYQQGILYLYGSFAGDSFIVRSAERHYVDAVSPLFKNSTPFLQHNSAEGKKDYWVIKASTRFTFLRKPSLDDISDWTGFLRAFIEIQSCLDLRPHKSRGGAPIRTPRLRIFGARDDLEQIMRHLPAAQKRSRIYAPRPAQRLRSITSLRVKSLTSWILSMVPRAMRPYGPCGKTYWQQNKRAAPCGAALLLITRSF